MAEQFYQWNSNPQSKPMIQTHGKKILSMELIKAHDSISWKIIYQKAQFLLVTSKNPVLTDNIKKAQFSLATSKKPNFHWQHQKNLILTSNIKKPSSHWQY